MPKEAPKLTRVSKIKRTAATYYRLTKPGIVYSNVMTAVAGYLFASRWHIHLVDGIALPVGTALIIASACVLNNYLDHGIDAKMERTQKRALVTGDITRSTALQYAAILGFSGFLILSLTNILTVAVGIAAFISYVIIYGFAKRHSVHGTLVGTIPGGASLVAGYTAATSHLDIAALMLFAIMVVWQMAHFYAIAIFRRDDYRAAGIPVRPVVKGVTNAKIHIVGYVIAYALMSPSLALVSHVGFVYAAIMIVAGLLWTWVAIDGFSAPDNARWARKTFGYSLIVLLVFCVALPLGVLLP